VSDFWMWVLAVIEHWHGYVSGGVLAFGLELLERFREWKPSKKVFATILALGFLASIFAAWKDEHTKVLNQVTYFQLRPAAENSQVVYQEGVIPELLFSETHGDYPALNVVQSSGLEISDLSKPFDPDDFEGDVQIEEIAWKRFLSDFDSFSVGGIVPHDSNILVASLNRKLTKEEAEGLIGHTKILYVLAYVAWTDGAGRHEVQKCQFFPTVPIPNRKLFSMSCHRHIGLSEKATH
jgi:hypothetical protein